MFKDWNAASIIAWSVVCGLAFVAAALTSYIYTSAILMVATFAAVLVAARFVAQRFE